jgi:hypothetical protein
LVPDPADHAGGGPFARKFDGLESEHEGGDGLAIFRRDDRHGDDLVDGFAGTTGAPPQVAGLRFVGHGVQGELGFLRRLQPAHFAGVGRSDDGSAAVEEAVKPGVKGERGRLP